MSFDFRFEPPTANELEELGRFDIDCDHDCDNCFWDCGEDEDE